MHEKKLSTGAGTKSSKLLSIIIPTKNRADYCLSALHSMRGITSEEIEILVVDNSDIDMSAKVSAIGNPSIRYVHCANPVSVNENFNQAIAMAKGRYVTLLGDDDGVHPGILEIARKVEQQGIDVLTTTRPAQYYWPDVKSRLYGTAFSGNLELKPFSGALTALDPKETLWACLESGARVVGELPKAYYGIVRKTCLDELKTRTGAICRLSPDMSMSVGLVFTIGKLVRLDFPVFLPGTSGRSTAGLGAAGKHRGRLEDQPHLSREDLSQWCPMNPRFFAGSTVWAEACLRALEAAGRGEGFSHFSFLNLYARCLVFEPDQWREVLRTFFVFTATTKRNPLLCGLVVGLSYLGVWLKRIATVFQNIADLAGFLPKRRYAATAMEPAIGLLSAKANLDQIRW